MTDKAIFRVDHPSGSYEIVVSEFFGTADKRKIKKLLRIAAQYCTEAQRKDLIADLGCGEQPVSGRDAEAR